ncbi:DUF3189 family protein [Desulfallas thermosapovorans]|uniref:Uncharacterized protein DUF3189 n=1 Tax=Desulfallas thermosapovorans DSM 6562 TaxID=1121431 RepID=A0A5S4ZSD1_9FIRM|nr:DUF3189 family protein [Desulfallas thermosapovorans]TYO95558.1 uncharacterized protein DUF3189 [Desulfallas thermosapovorans DSM 6562]
MKRLIFFNDTGFPYAAIAAAARSGTLPVHRPPEPQELARVLARTGMGRGDATVYHLGDSGEGESCLALWSQGNGDMVRRAIKSFLAIMCIDNYELVQIKCRKTFGVKVGTWLAAIPGFRKTGMLLIHRHVVNIYRELVSGG